MSTTSEVRSTPQPRSRPLWRRLIGFNLLTAVILGVGGYYLGWFIGHQIDGGKASNTRPRPTRTTSRCCSPTSSA